MSEPPPPSDGPLVLVADDDEDIVELVRRRLEKSGYTVISALDGAQALTLARERAPAVAILDVMMPGLDGHEVTRRLRADELTRDIGIIILTAVAQESARELSAQLGADIHIRKPFSPRELAAQVDALLDSRAE
jgi:two-component system phosphate regulon response regulator PhoB